MVELPSDWDERKRWRVAGHSVGGEEAKPITTDIISGDWEDSRGSVIACVTMLDASNNLVDTCNSVRLWGRAAWLHDNTS